MVRALVLLLVLLNLGLFAWHQGLLHEPLGIGPQAQREPERLGLQVRPDSVRVLGAQAASQAAAMAAPPPAAPGSAGSAPLPPDGAASGPPAAPGSAPG